MLEHEHRRLLAHRLTMARNMRMLSVDDVAKKLHETTTVIKKHEAGEAAPRPYMLCKYADLYDVSLDWLCGRTNVRRG